MALIKPHILGLALLLVSGCAQAQEDWQTDPIIENFLAAGFGALHERAPEETLHFGQLSGIWRFEAVMLGADGEWIDHPPGYWLWKYTLNGFATQDLWYMPADQLPDYAASMEREYTVMASRIFEPDENTWHVAWMSNGAGEGPGDEFGTFSAGLNDGNIVMTAPGTEEWPYDQRITFSDISDTSFTWTSEITQDGGDSWTTLMVLTATRLCRPGQDLTLESCH